MDGDLHVLYLCCVPSSLEDGEIDTPELAGAESYEWEAHSNLDSFFSRVYRCDPFVASQPGVFLVVPWSPLMVLCTRNERPPPQRGATLQLRIHLCFYVSP